MERQNFLTTRTLSARHDWLEDQEQQFFYN